MSLNDTLMRTGLAALFRLHARECRFRGELVNALVDINPDDTAARQGDYNMLAGEQSVVVFNVSALRDPPMKGEVLQDEFDRHHRITSVTRDAISYRCVCEVADGP